MNVAVIGAGLAGLVAACDVAGAGCRTTILERRPWAGGKTYSFVDRETGDAIDNGQHIAMRCTTEYIAFLEQIGTSHLIRWQDRLRVPVFDPDGRRSDLAASSLPAPLHLAPSFARYKLLSAREKLAIGRAILAMRRISDTDRTRLDEVSFGSWLGAHGQSATAIRDFWDLILVPALNCRSDDASAAQAMFVFREGFLKSAQSAAIGVPTVGLSALHVDPAVRYIEDRGGEVRTGATVEAIECDGDHISGVRLATGDRIEADAYICALPPKQTLDVLPGEIATEPPFRDLASIRTSPIVNVHLWFGGPIADLPFAAFIGSDLQWMFRPQADSPAPVGAQPVAPVSIAPPSVDSTTHYPHSSDHIVLSLSSAERFADTTKPELVALLLPQLQRALPLARSRTLLRSAVIKEPDATFVPFPGLRRPGVRTPIANLVLAGAHIDTGWPATMESAVRSGRMAARAVLDMQSSIEQVRTPPDPIADAVAV